MDQHTFGNVHTREDQTPYRRHRRSDGYAYARDKRRYIIGFFKKSDPPKVPSSGLASPVAVEVGDMDRVRRLLHQFEEAVGDDASIRYFARELNQAGGWKSAYDTATLVRDWGQGVVHRPWKWVTEVARAALLEGDTPLAAKISVMAEFWHSEFVPRQVLADQLDGEIGGPPKQILAELCRLGLGALSALPDSDTVVHSQRRGETVTADAALIVCCLRIIRLGEDIVGSNTLDQAYSTLLAKGIERSRADEGAISLRS